MLKQLLATAKVVTLALILSFGLSYALAWTSPTATPPGGNVDAPINVGGTAQVKSGGLTVGSLTTSGAVTAGTLKVTTGAGAAKVLTSDAAGNATWQAAAGGSDNLGNHTATQNLNLAGFGITGANTISAADVFSSTGGFWMSTATPHGSAVFRSSGVWIAPQGVTKVYLSGSGGGGNGGPSGYSYGYAGSSIGGTGAVGYGTGSAGSPGQNYGPPYNNGALGGAGGAGPGYSSATAATPSGVIYGGGGGGLGQSVFKREIVVTPGQSYPITIGAGAPTTFGGAFSIAKGGDGGTGTFYSSSPGANGTQELPIFGASGGGGGGAGWPYGGAGGAGAPGYLIVEW